MKKTETMKKTMNPTGDLKAPPAELRALWAAWATLDRHSADTRAAEAAWWKRAGGRCLLRGPVQTLLQDGLTEADVRRFSRNGVDPLGTSALSPGAFRAFCLCLEDLAYESPAGSRERRTVQRLIWCAANVRARCRAERRKREGQAVTSCFHLPSRAQYDRAY